MNRSPADRYPECGGCPAGGFNDRSGCGLCGDQVSDLSFG